MRGDSWARGGAHSPPRKPTTPHISSSSVLDLIGRFVAQEFAIHFLISICDGPQGEMFRQTGTAAFPHRAPPFGAQLKQLDKRCFESVGVARRNHDASVPQQKSCVPNIGSDTRDPGTHGFRYNIGEPFPEGIETEDVETPKYVGHIGPFAKQAEAIRCRTGVDPAHELAIIGVITAA